MTPTVPARVIDLGQREFGEVWRLQLDTVAARQRDEVPDTLFLVEHPHVITLGRSAKRENLLDGTRMPVFEIERGGDVTYHGPGQLVGYPVFLLRPSERDLHLYLRRIEESIIRALDEFGIEAERRGGLTGVWVPTPAGARKIASIGVAVKRWVTLHGFALNVTTDLRQFATINPCGLDAAVMTSVSERLGRAVTVDQMRTAMTKHVADVFARAWI